jgi:hypothetical protein
MSGRRAKPKYQVFISSTYDDLREEREAVTWEVLKANHIPVGMENFAASDDRGWKTIQRAIDRSDYYVVIVAGKYGSVDPDTGISWTEREYQYARSIGVPVLAFIRADSTTVATRMEDDPKKSNLLAGFKRKLNEAHHRKRWEHVSDLRVEVVHALRQQIDADEEGDNPRPGWYRGDEIPTGLAVEEFARLSAENLELRAKVSAAEQIREQLTLLRRDGSPLGDQSYDVPSYSAKKERVPTDTSPGYHVVATALAGPSLASEEVLAYLSDLSLVHWVILRLRNDGGKPAKRIVARFSCADADGVVIGDLEKPSAIAFRREVVTPFHYRATEHVYVSDEDNGPPASVEQRIQQVGVGGSENFVAMGFRGRRPHVGAFSFTLKIVFEIRSEDGVITSGSFTETVNVGATTKVLPRDKIFD